MKLIIEYVKKYKVTYIGVVLVFIVGIILGICVTFKISNNEKIEIKDYIQTSMNSLKENQMDKQIIFKQTFMNNIKFLIIVWILGCTVIAGFTIYILMIYKGFLLGYIITAILSIFGIKQGINFLFPILILQNIIFLPIIFLLAKSGIRMNKGIIKKEINIKYELIRHCIIMIIAIIFNIIISYLEAYLSTFMLNFL